MLRREGPGSGGNAHVDLLPDFQWWSCFDVRISESRSLSAFIARADAAMIAAPSGHLRT